MNQDQRASARQLPIEVLDELAASAVEIGMRYEVHAHALHQLGFRFFQAVFDKELIGCNEEEKEEHRLIAMEMAKEIVGACGPQTAPLYCHGRGYASPLLEQLRAERDAQGIATEQFQTAGDGSWRFFLGKCQQSRMKRFLADTHSTHLTYPYVYLSDVEQQARDFEIGAVTTGLVRDRVRHLPRWNKSKDLHPSKDWIHAMRAATRIFLDKELKNLGFRFNQKLSTSAWLCYVLQIAGLWQLRFSFYAIYPQIEVHLYFCHETLPRRPVGTLGCLYDPLEHFEIYFAETAPGFSIAYRNYGTADEIEVNFRAYVALYRMEHEFIVGFLKRVATQLTDGHAT